MKHLAIALVLLTSTVAHGAPSTATILAKVQSRYRGITHLRAQYHQDVVDKTVDMHTTTRGTMWLARPALARFDQLDDRDGSEQVARTTVMDGKTLVTLDVARRSAMITPSLVPGSTPLGLAFFFDPGSLTTGFDAALDTSGSYGAPDDFVLALKPHADGGSLTLVIDHVDFHVKESIEIDGSGDVSRVAFEKVDVVAKPPAATFSVKPPPNYQIVKP